MNPDLAFYMGQKLIEFLFVMSGSAGVVFLTVLLFRRIARV